MENNQSTKLCKYCKAEIPQIAEICPNCRKKQNGGKLKWIIIAVVVLAVIGIVFGKKEETPQEVENTTNESTNNDENSTDTAEPTEEVAEEPQEKIFKVGETAELNGVKVTMTDYKESKGKEYNKPTDGNVFVLAEFEIENNTDEELNISSLLSFEAYADDYALNYSLSALLAKKDATQLDGTIAPGKKMKGCIGYEVASDWKNIEIHFTDNVWSDSKFKFEINK